MHTERRINTQNKRLLSNDGKVSPFMVILSLTKNRTTLRQAQGEWYCSAHAEPDEARQAQCERKMQTNFYMGTYFAFICTTSTPAKDGFNPQELIINATRHRVINHKTANITINFKRF